jgi:hypothetical protein
MTPRQNRVIDSHEQLKQTLLGVSGIIQKSLASCAMQTSTKPFEGPGPGPGSDSFIYAHHIVPALPLGIVDHVRFVLRMTLHGIPPHVRLEGVVFYGGHIVTELEHSGLLLTHLGVDASAFVDMIWNAGFESTGFKRAVDEWIEARTLQYLQMRRPEYETQMRDEQARLEAQAKGQVRRGIIATFKVVDSTMAFSTRGTRPIVEPIRGR